MAALNPENPSREPNPLGALRFSAAPGAPVNPANTSRYRAGGWDYQQLKTALRNEQLPCMVVDLDKFDANAERVVSAARNAGKTLRPATKSVRVPALLKRLAAVGADVISGQMSYSLREAAYLQNLGFTNQLVAYPTVQIDDLKLAFQRAQEKRPIVLMIDDAAHLRLIDAVWKQAANGSPAQPCKELRGTFAPGDPVFFRPAKSGEIAERFNEYLLMRGGEIVGREKTYRWLGQCFF